MRRYLTAACVCLLVLVPAPAAGTRGSAGCELMRILDVASGAIVTKVVCGGHISGLGTGGPGEPGSAGDARIVYPLIARGPDGGLCMYLARVTPVPGWTYLPDHALALYLAEGMPWCPGFEPTPPGAWVIDWWRDQTLPTPAPAIPPGQMVVGWPAFLDAHAPMSLTLSDDSPFGPLRVELTSTLTVDWGDGTIAGPYDTAGGAWPSGDITHTYQQRGLYTVVVVQTWTGTWSMGTERGTLPATTTTGTVDGFPVREVQAVGR